MGRCPCNPRLIDPDRVNEWLPYTYTSVGGEPGLDCQRNPHVNLREWCTRTHNGSHFGPNGKSALDWTEACHSMPSGRMDATTTDTIIAVIALTALAVMTVNYICKAVQRWQHHCDHDRDDDLL